MSTSTGHPSVQVHGEREDRTESFRVDGWTDRLGGLVFRNRRFWVRFGNLETKALADRLRSIRTRRPVYVTGLARGGSTILLETLASHPATATHRYRDYPFLYTPVLWNAFLDRVPRRRSEPVERAHHDGILVTPESPEAFEEILWMTFFPGLHDGWTSSVLGSDAAHPAFETFYRDHIRKMLLVRKGLRYVAKANYHVTRLGYLLKIFPDARFVIVVREPAGHVASLMKQHALFREAETKHPAALRHMQRVGHFEFGLDRRLIDAGDTVSVERIRELWDRGEEIEGWARYWSHIYEHVADRLETDAALREASLVVRFEDLCRSPAETIQTILDHCGLPAPPEFVEHVAGTIRYPTYYAPNFHDDELERIDRCTRHTAKRFGYSGVAGGPPARHSAPLRRRLGSLLQP